ncbi:hypothetical protein H0H92_006442 [Tricholoma furcatifolium]|nr:hypothetical protein H0H92_006442 [Tricholoma furcatifolium]
MPELRKSTRLKTQRKVASEANAHSPSPSLPPTKRRKTKITATPGTQTNERRIRGTRGKLRLITEMPLDILYETFSHLEPADLLHLCRAKKSLRSVLLNPQANSVWKASFDNMEDPPPGLLEDMSYPTYALLLFSTACHNGTTENCHTYVYYQDELASVRFILESLTDETAKEEFKKKQTAFRTKCHEHALEYENWVDDRKQKRKESLTDLRLQRIDGWEPELTIKGGAPTPYRRRAILFGFPGADKAQALTDKIWNNIRGEIVARLEIMRIVRLQDERRTRLEHNINLLSSFYSDYADRQSRRSPIPSLADICTIEPFRSMILLSRDADSELDKEDFDLHKDDFPRICAEWTEAKSKELQALLPAERSRLDLALSLFRCKWCKEPIHYPRILKHECLITQHASKDANTPDYGDLKDVYSLVMPTACPWNWVGSQVEYYEEAAARGSAVIRACGADPLTVTAEEMDALDCRVECQGCADTGRRNAMWWAAAVVHATESHDKEQRWKLYENEEQLAKIKALESNHMNGLGCNHCGRVVGLNAMSSHLRKHQKSVVTKEEMYIGRALVKVEERRHTFVPLDDRHVCDKQRLPPPTTMKFIENPALSRLAQTLTHDGPECSVHCRMEAYSCKNVKRDKKLFKSLESAYQDEVSHSPPLPSWLALDKESEMTPFGPMDQHASRKTLYLLIATLNIAFPDYDFSDVRPSHFNKEQSGASVLNSLSNTLVAPHRSGMTAPRTYSSYPPTSPDFFPNSVPTSSSPYQQLLPSPLAPPPIVSGTHPTLFRLIDDVIGLSECEVYSYAPEIDSDPHANDLSDEEDDIASIADEDSSSDDGAFEFDDYDIDEAYPRSYGEAHSIPLPAPRKEPEYLSDEGSPSYPHIRMKRRGALLWSSHWFFLNRKLKRILFVTVWARTRGLARSWSDDELYPVSSAAKDMDSSERFIGWEGGVGAGARAMGLQAAAA